MNRQVAGPLIIICCAILAILIARPFVVPEDFGVHERGYTLGWHRKGDEEVWKSVKVKYQGAEYCMGCHEENYQRLSSSPHRIINCENCHGPALGHPEDPQKLELNRSNALCLRCHLRLEYPTSGRERIRGLDDPEAHAQGMECTSCHNPHSPKLT